MKGPSCPRISVPSLSVPLYFVRDWLSEVAPRKNIGEKIPGPLVPINLIVGRQCNQVGDQQPSICLKASRCGRTKREGRGQQGSSFATYVRSTTPSYETHCHGWKGSDLMFASRCQTLRRWKLPDRNKIDVPGHLLLRARQQKKR